MTRTKEAVIELFTDEGGTLVSAYEAAEFAAFNPDTDEEPPEPIYEACSSRTSDSPMDTPKEEYDRLCALEEQNATLQVLGWLWQHNYKSARWGCKMADCCGGESPKPDWATKEVYMWGDDKK